MKRADVPQHDDGRFDFVRLADERRRSTPTHAPDGVLRLNVDIAIDMREFASWPPQCVAAFFDGVAKVLGAKAHADEALSVPRAAEGQP